MPRKQSSTMRPSLVNTAVTRIIDLDPRDWMRATWRPREPLPRPEQPEPAPFDQNASVARLAALPVDSFGWWEWGHLTLAPALSRAEAHFWLRAVLQSRQFGETITPAEVAQRLARETFDGRPTLDEIETWFARGTPSAGIPHVFHTLLTLLTPAEILELLARGPAWPKGNNIVGYWDWPSLALDWFARDVFPYLTNEEVAAARPVLRQRIAAATWTRNSLGRPDPAFHLGALLGLHDEMLTIVQTAPWGHPHYHRPHDIVFGLGSADLVIKHMHRLSLNLESAVHVRAWLAHMELSALDHVRDSILAVKNKDEATPLAEALALVRSPEAAPLMLELKRSSKAPQVARHWLDTEVGNAVADLLPMAAGDGPLTDDALDYLREVKRRGHGDLIAEQSNQAGGKVAEAIRRLVLDPVEKVYPPLDETSTPAWLRAALATLAGRKAPRLPAWADPQRLPPVVIGDHRLSDEQTVAMLAALRESHFGSPTPLLVALKQHADRPALEAFAWGLFRAWLAESAPASGKWALTALGHLGDDTTVGRLAELVRAWPGEGQSKRAIHGLECLSEIGSEAARQAIADIARQTKYKTLRDRARELLNEAGL